MNQTSDNASLVFLPGRDFSPLETPSRVYAKRHERTFHDINKVYCWPRVGSSRKVQNEVGVPGKSLFQTTNNLTALSGNFGRPRRICIEGRKHLADFLITSQKYFWWNFLKPSKLNPQSCKRKKLLFLFIVSSNYGWKYCENIFARLKRLQTQSILFYQQASASTTSSPMETSCTRAVLRITTMKTWESAASVQRRCCPDKNIFPHAATRKSRRVDGWVFCAVVFNVNIMLNSSTCLYLSLCE